MSIIYISNKGYVSKIYKEKPKNCLLLQVSYEIGLFGSPAFYSETDVCLFCFHDILVGLSSHNAKGQTTFTRHQPSAHLL